MTDYKKEFGIIGLGKMGMNLTLQALEKGMKVIGMDRKKPSEKLLEKGMMEAEDFKSQSFDPKDYLKKAFILLTLVPAVVSKEHVTAHVLWLAVRREL